ncbi:MAG: hypothetical protein CMC63_10095 [Flavobacteriaceae bacterium]|nr:hypothetical protein [Flavobacteriaceae bacterium]|tara:strand:- start:54 stop:467 length:414 start_codon:yes stop_codon:yes gene_type:complete
MKKIIIAFTFLICTNAYSQEIPFKIIDGDIEWEELYAEDLDIESQTIFFTAPNKKGGEYVNKCEQADLYVYKKNGITRLRVRNFMFIVPPTFPELERVANIAINEKGFKKHFIIRDAKILDGMVKKSIDDLLGYGDD